MALFSLTYTQKRECKRICPPFFNYKRTKNSKEAATKIQQTILQTLLEFLQDQNHTLFNAAVDSATTLYGKSPTSRTADSLNRKEHPAIHTYITNRFSNGIFLIITTETKLAKRITNVYIIFPKILLISANSLT